jgi:serine/threonine-protein kinase RsbW
MKADKPSKFLAQTDNLVEIRHYIDSRLSSLGVLNKAECDDIILAAMEAAANICIHGYQGQGGVIEVEVARGIDSVTVLLRDRADVFDLDCIPTPDTTIPLEDRPLGGMGVHLIRQLMDEVDCKSLPDGGNELTLIKEVRFIN